jgi:hypothetical protein
LNLVMFTAASFAAGLFNYLYQVLAARALTAAEFAEFSRWLAHVSAIMMVGGWFQFWSLFNPVSKQTLRRVLVGFAVLSLPLSLLWLQGDQVLGFERSLSLVLLSLATGWLSGQVHIRMWFGVLAVAGLLVAVTKVASTQFTFFAGQPMDPFVWALLLSPIPQIFVLAIWLWRAGEMVQAQSPRKLGLSDRWISPMVLSAATALAPQFDLILLSHTLAETVFQGYSRASIYSRGLYFSLFILAQWLLPKMLRGHHTRVPMFYLMGGGLALALGLTVISPWMGKYLLGWSEQVPMHLVFWSCMSTLVMATSYLTIQSACAAGPFWRVGGIAVWYVLLFIGQWVLQWPVDVFLPLTQIGWLVLYLTGDKSPLIRSAHR